MAEQDPKVQEALDYVRDNNRALLAHKQVLLTVRLNTEEDADQIFKWMYSKDKPMTAELLAIAWDRETVSKEVKEALDLLKQSL